MDESLIQQDKRTYDMSHLLDFEEEEVQNDESREIIVAEKDNYASVSTTEAFEILDVEEDGDG